MTGELRAVSHQIGRWRINLAIYAYFFTFSSLKFSDLISPSSDLAFRYTFAPLRFLSPRNMEVNNIVAVTLGYGALTCAAEVLATLLASALLKTQLLAQEYPHGPLLTNKPRIREDHAHGQTGPTDAEESDGNEEDDDDEDGGFGEGEDDLSDEAGDYGNHPNNNKSNPKKGPGGGAGGAEENGEGDEEEDDEEDGDGQDEDDDDDNENEEEDDDEDDGGEEDEDEAEGVDNEEEEEEDEDEEARQPPKKRKK
ncbi:hypothetical protein CFOL_v3_03457 [Cephalotus follicularis]|uniref:Uncharacterized protein n=1 Tax=Cephalotus follicularis TaxID=3775 RepID=A0A1Q3AVY9_CEPFO|nr:hypothetical protein CFOL_v3_03457 [Cephalotus follicularis]